MQTPADGNNRFPEGTSHLPVPRRDAHWRWSASRRVLVGGGVLAAVLGLGSAAAGAATSTTKQPPAGALGGPPPGMAKPAAAGKITAIAGEIITVQDRAKSSETIVYSSSTTFKTMSGTTTASALKVGDFIAAMGTKSSDGTVNATAIVIGAPPGRGSPGGKPPAGKGTPPPKNSSTSSS